MGSGVVAPSPFFSNQRGDFIQDTIRIVIDKDTIERYNVVYFAAHPKARKPPIKQPYHESINVWMIMKRPMMNALKQRWKDFAAWVVKDQGYANLLIEKCEMRFDTYYPTNRRHDTDNSCPKFIIDGLCQGGFIIDDDHLHLTLLSLCCHVDHDHPRTEITVTMLADKEKEN